MSSITHNAHEKLPPIHPGEILNEEFLEPLNISQYRLAKSISVDPRVFTPSCMESGPFPRKLRCCWLSFFGTSAAFWMGLQNQYDLEIAEDRHRR